MHGTKPCGIYMPKAWSTGCCCIVVPPLATILIMGRGIDVPSICVGVEHQGELGSKGLVEAVMTNSPIRGPVGSWTEGGQIPLPSIIHPLSQDPCASNTYTSLFSFTFLCGYMHQELWTPLIPVLQDVLLYLGAGYRGTCLSEVTTWFSVSSRPRSRILVRGPRTRKS